MLDNKTLQARMRAREKTVPVGGFEFVIRRPKFAEMGRDYTRLELVKAFTVGWNVKGIDLVPGGDPEIEPFDPDLFADWVDDQPKIWTPLGTAIMDMFHAYNEAQDSAAKN